MLWKVRVIDAVVVSFSRQPTVGATWLRAQSDCPEMPSMSSSSRGMGQMEAEESMAEEGRRRKSKNRSGRTQVTRPVGHSSEFGHVICRASAVVTLSHTHPTGLANRHPSSVTPPIPRSPSLGKLYHQSPAFPNRPIRAASLLIYRPTPLFLLPPP